MLTVIAPLGISATTFTIWHFPDDNGVVIATGHKSCFRVKIRKSRCQNKAIVRLET